jgi:CBS domain-containing protein
MYLLSKDASLEDALVAITENKRGAILVVDKDDTLLGVVSDGDIRRALVKGATMLTPIGKIVNMNVRSISKNEDAKVKSAEIQKSYPGINIIPVLNAGNRVCDVFVRH